MAAMVGGAAAPSSLKTRWDTPFCATPYPSRSKALPHSRSSMPLAAEPRLFRRRSEPPSPPGWAVVPMPNLLLLFRRFTRLRGERAVSRLRLVPLEEARELLPPPPPRSSSDWPGSVEWDSWISAFSSTDRSATIQK